MKIEINCNYHLSEEGYIRETFGGYSSDRVYKIISVSVGRKGVKLNLYPITDYRAGIPQELQYKDLEHVDAFDRSFEIVDRALLKAILEDDGRVKWVLRDCANATLTELTSEVQYLPELSKEIWVSKGQLIVTAERN